MSTVVSRRAANIGRQLRDTTEIFIGILIPLDEVQWRLTVPPDGRIVGVVARHLADSHPFIVDSVRTVTRGADLPWTWEAVDEANAQHAKAFAECGQAETITALRSSANAAADAVSGFSDEELDMTTQNPLLSGQLTSVAELLHRTLVRHTLWHMGDIQRALI